MKLSWKNVLNGNHKNHDSVYSFYRDIVMPSGYTHFVWEEKVYEIISCGNVIETSYKIEDIA